MKISIFLMFIFLLTFFILNMFSPLMKVNLSFMDWSFLNLKMNLNFSSLIFSSILFIIVCVVIFYSMYYMNGEIYFNYYFTVLMLFVMSMFMLIFSNNLTMMLISWDLLGVSSFFLVLFYMNWDSSSGSMNTVLTNRLGDYFLFIFFSTFVFSNLFFFSSIFLNQMIISLLILTSFTKSAQFPFSGWLPKAMSAPTPVSSLVHSSTLVTAGLILLFNFKIIIYFKFSSMILNFGCFTMFFSSITAMFEEDMKKVVALSTLSQMGFSMTTVGLGFSFLSLFHLISHALFKSCLFIQIGFIIHNSFNQQDGRLYNNNSSLSISMQMQMIITLFCLCGLFFSSGSVSKDLILELFYSNFFNITFFLFFILSVFFTFIYSWRLWKSIYKMSSKSISITSNSKVFNFNSLILAIFSFLFIWWMNMNFLTLPAFFNYLDFFFPLFFIAMFILLIVFFFKLYMKTLSLKFKFLADYYPKFLQMFLSNTKFMDFFLNNGSLMFLKNMMSMSNMKILYFNNMFFMFTFFLMFILFI